MKTKDSGTRHVVWPVLILLLLTMNSALARWKEDVSDDDSGGGSYPPPPVYVFPVNGFDWQAPNRWKMWPDAWHERGGQSKAWPVETYQSTYINPSSWSLYLMGCQNSADFYQDVYPDDFPATKNQYVWSWNGTQTSPSGNCYRALSFPEQGTYQVTLTVTFADGTTKTWTNPVRVQDFLIVVLGDSSASGEGAPDKPVTPIEGEAGLADWVDNRCHRSMHAGGSQAAKRLEDSSPHSSVTFISFACSGATLIAESWHNEAPLAAFDPYEIEDTLYRGVGITDEYAGIEPLLLPNGDADFSQKLPAQTDALRSALRPIVGVDMRKIDALMVAGGINDARFSDLAAVCVLYDQCFAEGVGDEFNEVLLDEQFQEDLLYIQPGWEEMTQQLFAAHDPIEVDTLLALQYPPFFRDDDGEQCDWILDDSIPTWARVIATGLGLLDLGWFPDEIDWAESQWAVWLDEEVRAGAENNGFTYVDTIAERFDRHGICADDRYVNTPTDSAAIQGDDTGEASAFASMFSKGTAHPNFEGYQAYADEIMNHLSYMTDNNPPFPKQDVIWGTQGFEKFMYSEVLFNDFDADGDDLVAWVATVPSQGKVTMDSFGFAYWDSTGVTAPYQGSFVYTVSDGVETRFSTVDIFYTEMVLVPVTTVSSPSSPEPMLVGGLVGQNVLEGPYKVVFPDYLDVSLPTGPFGQFRVVPGEDRIWYTAPTVKKPSKFEVRFEVQSQTLNRNSPSFGQSIQGILQIEVNPARKG